MTTFPIVATDPLDTFGLGTRRLMPGFGPVSYGAGERPSARSRTGVHGHLPGGQRGDGGARRLGGVASPSPPGHVDPRGHGGRVSRRLLLLLGDVSLELSPRRLVGSIYFVPPWCRWPRSPSLGALELHRRRSVAWISRPRLVRTVPVMVNRHRASTTGSAGRRSRGRSPSMRLDEPSLVIVAESGPYLLFKNPVSQNSPELDDDDPLRRGSRGRELRHDPCPSRPDSLSPGRLRRGGGADTEGGSDHPDRRSRAHRARDGSRRSGSNPASSRLMTIGRGALLRHCRARVAGFT